MGCSANILCLIHLKSNREQASRIQIERPALSAGLSIYCSASYDQDCPQANSQLSKFLFSKSFFAINTLKTPSSLKSFSPTCNSTTLSEKAISSISSCPSWQCV